jgi:hypothetical protein
VKHAKRQSRSCLVVAYREESRKRINRMSKTFKPLTKEEALQLLSAQIRKPDLDAGQ